MDHLVYKHYAPSGVKERRHAKGNSVRSGMFIETESLQSR
jgi:hypothetical protein